MLNRSGDRGHPCLIPDLIRKASILMCKFAKAAITKCHRLGGLKEIRLTILEAKSPKIKVLEN